MSQVTMAGGGGAGGDVVGIPPSTDNAIVRWSGASGKLIQNSGTTLSDLDVLSTGELNLTTDLAVQYGGTGASTFTDGGIVLGSGANPFTVTAQPTDGQLLIGSTGNDPVLSTLTAGANVTIVEGAGTITISATGGISSLDFVTDAGTATSVAGSINLLGGTGISTSGAAGTVTVTLDTPVTVGNGGTGATTLGDGYVLLGSGANAITALDVTAKGSLLVGDGTTDPVALAVGTDTYVLTADSGEASGLKWAAASAGNTKKEYWFSAESMQPLETNFAPLEKLSGANVNTFVRSFDDTTEEFVNAKLQVPGEVESGSTVTFRIYAMAKTAAASKNVKFTFGHLAINDSEDFDQAYTDKSWDDQPIDATQDDVTEFVLTETLANLGWSANDLVLFRLSREAATTNNLAGDLYLFSLCIEIPRSA